jgi:hypothetical protein
VIKKCFSSWCLVHNTNAALLSVSRSPESLVVLKIQVKCQTNVSLIFVELDRFHGITSA